MGAAVQQTFKRVEKKYVITAAQCEALIKRMSHKMEPDRFGRTTILNIYYDTPDHRLIRQSLLKPVYKEKLRVRSYGVPKDSSKVFVELKKKYKGVVYKRRVDMSLAQAKDFVRDDVRPGLNPQIESEIAYFLKFYEGIAPAMFLSYERIAFAGIDNPDLRITFDSRITYREDDLALEKGIYGKLLIPDDIRVLEIKIPGAVPLWLSRIMDELGIFPASFSKYGEAYKTELKAYLGLEDSEPADVNETEKGKVNYCA